MGFAGAQPILQVASARSQQPSRMNAVDISHEGRMDRIADQLACALRQFVRHFCGDRERQFSSCRTHPTQYCGVMIRRGRSDRLAPPRCHSVPLVIASDPDGIVSLTASGRSPS